MPELLLLLPEDDYVDITGCFGSNTSIDDDIRCIELGDGPLGRVTGRVEEIPFCRPDTPKEGIAFLMGNLICYSCSRCKSEAHASI